MDFKRHILVFLTLASFLAAQALVSAHAAEFGSGEHKHHGHTCDVYLFSEHAKSSPLPAAPVIPVPIFIAAPLPPSSLSAITGVSYRPALPRAPPAPLS